MQKTKIIATLGPACENPTTIKKMLHSGLNVFRINASHSQNLKHINKTIKTIRLESQKLNKSVSIMMDLGGPKIRIALPTTVHKIQITKDNTYRVGFKKYEIPLNTKIKISELGKKNKKILNIPIRTLFWGTIRNELSVHKRVRVQWEHPTRILGKSSRS